MDTLIRARLAFLALLFLAAVALADPPAATPPDQAGKSLPQVTVEADRVALERRLFNFVTEITRTAPRDESLRIWRAPICPLVAGLPQEQGEFMLARLSGACAARRRRWIDSRPESARCGSGTTANSAALTPDP